MKVTAQEKQSDLPTVFKQFRHDDKLQIIELVRRWGGLTTDALLDPNCQYFSIPAVEGFIGYRMEWGCAISYGDPVCAPQHTLQLAQAFQDFCQKECKNIIYLTASDTFAKLAIQHLCKLVIEYGEEIALDPHCNPRDRQGTHASLVRRKVRHAQHEGVSVKEYIPYDAKMEQVLEQVGIDWLKSRRGLQIHISNIHLFDNRMGKRWFYAQKAEKVVAIVVLNQIQARQGWHLNHLMITPEASHGTPELLVVSVLEILQSENCSYVSCGVTPADRLRTIIGLTSFSAWIARQIYSMAGKAFHLKGHKTFWKKFHPQTQPSYLLFSQPHLGLRETFALLRAMNVSLY